MSETNPVKPEPGGEAETRSNVSGGSTLEPPYALPMASGGPAVGSLSQAWGRLSLGAKLLFLLATLLGLGWLIDQLGPVLTPFLFGAILAYLGLPAMAWLEARRMPRAAGAILVIVILIGAIALLALIVAPLVIAEVQKIGKALPELFNRAQTIWLPWVNERLGLTLALDFSQLRTLATEHSDVLGEFSKKLAGSLKLGGQFLLGLLINVMLIPVVMFYLLRDGPRLIASLDALTPSTWQGRVRHVAREIDAVLSEFLRGQGLVMLALAVYYSLALWLVGLDYALAVGLVTGLLVFIPYVGFGLGLTLGLLAALTQFSSPGPILLIALVFAGGQLLEGFLLVPNLVGDRIGLHPLAVIFALMAFGQLFGFVGILLALPASAVLLVLLRHLRQDFAVEPSASTGTPPA